MSPFTRGGIFYLFLVGLSLQDIANQVIKPDGTHPSKQGVADVIDQAKANGGKRWDGVLSTDAGRPRSTTPELDKAIVKIVYKCRGRTSVTAKFVKKTLKQARHVSLRTIERRLVEAAYWKAQGLPVRVWGLLAGVIFITILPEGTCMNSPVYAGLIKKHLGYGCVRR